jgi:hypothetical protein
MSKRTLIVDATCPLADLARADIAAATEAVAAAAEDDDDTETEDRPGSPSSVCARTPAPHQRRASRTYGFLGCSALPHSHRHQTCRPGARRQWPGENLTVIYAQGRARYWTGMRHRCPESGCVRGNVQAPVMRQKLRHGNCVVNSRCLKLKLSWNFVNESGIGKRR